MSTRQENQREQNPRWDVMVIRGELNSRGGG